MPSRVQIEVIIDGDDPAREVKKIESALDQMGVRTKTVTREGTQGFKNLADQGITRSIVQAGLLLEALESLGRGLKAVTVESATLAARADANTQSLAALAQVTGRSTTEFLSAQKRIEELNISTLTAQRTLSLFATRELDVADAVKLANVARSRAILLNRDSTESLSRLTLAVLKAEPELLDELNIVIRQNSAFREHAERLGKTVEELNEVERSQAILNQVWRQTANDQAAVAELTGTLSFRLQDLARQAQQAKIALGREFRGELDLTVTSLEKLFELVEAAPGLFSNLTVGVGAAALAFGAFRIGGPVVGLVTAGLGLIAAGVKTTKTQLDQLRDSLDLISSEEQTLEFTPAGSSPVFSPGALSQASRSAGPTRTRLQEFVLDRLSERTANTVKDLNQALTEQSKAGDKLVDENKKRQEELAKFLEQLSDRAFRANEVMFSEAENIARRAARQIDQLKANLKNFPEAAGAVAEAAEAIEREAQIRAAEAREKEFQQRIKPFIDARTQVEKDAAEMRIQIAEDEAAARREIDEREFNAVSDSERRLIDFQREVLLEGLGERERILAETQILVEEFAARENVTAQQVADFKISAEERAMRRIQDLQEQQARDQARLLERQQRDYDRFLDRIVRITEQSGSILSNIWRTLADTVRREITKMTIDLLIRGSGISPGVAGNRGAGGGILGGLLGLGGLGGGVFGGVLGPGGTPPFLPGGGGGAGNAASTTNLGPFFASLGLSGTGAQTGAARQLFGIDRAAAFRGLLTGGFLGVSAGLSGRPGLGAALGAGGTLLGVLGAGIASSGTFAGGIGALAAFATNPFGLLALGGIAGASFLVGVLSRGRKKERASDIANQGFGAIDEAIQEFMLHQLSFERTVATMNQEWSRMVAGWQQIGGGVGRNSIADQRRFFEERLARVRATQNERERRAFQLAAQPVPEFQSGGFVPFTQFARVHGGEMVIRREVVERVGRENLEQLNRGQGGGLGGEVNINVFALDAQSFSDALKSNRAAFSRAVVGAVEKNLRDGGRLKRLV